jgi:hypothetical protein
VLTQLQPRFPEPTGDLKTDYYQLVAAIGEYFRRLNDPNVLTIEHADINNAAIGQGTNGAAAGKFTNLVATGNTTLGDASGDTLTIAPNAVTWSNNPTHSGNHNFSASVTAEEMFVQSAASGADFSGKWQASGSANTATQSLFGINAYGWDGSAAQVAGTINFRSTETWSGAGWGSRIQFRAIAATTTTLTEFGSLDSRGWFSEKAYYLLDGLTPPAALVGYAVIYVDNLDGDLKVKFGDGTVKTLATDT